MLLTLHPSQTKQREFFQAIIHIPIFTAFIFGVWSMFGPK